MRTALFISVLLTVAWGKPFKQKELQVPPPETLQQPLVGDLLPAQGHVVFENPAPQPQFGKEVQRSALSPDNKEQEASQVQGEYVEVPAEASDVHDESPLKQDLTEENNEIEQVDAAAPFEEVILEDEEKEELQADLELKAEMINNNIVEVEEKEPLQKLDVQDDKATKYNFEQPIMKLEPLTNEKLKPEMSNYHFVEEEKESLQEQGDHNELEAKYNFEQPIMKLEPLIDEKPKPEIINYEFEEEEKESLQEQGDHNDLEVKYNIEQPIMKLEPLTDEEMQRDELLKVPDRHVVYEEPIMYLEPETFKTQFMNEKNIPAAVMAPEEEEPMLDPMGQPLRNIPYAANVPEEEGPMLDPMGQPLQNIHYAANVPEEEGLMLDPMGQPLHRSNKYFPFDEGLMRHEPLESGDQSQMLLHGEPLMHGLRSCSGVVLEGKCFQFFTNAKKASEAEYFCQQSFPGGHLASITCPYVHEQMMNLMRQNGGTRRTWVGGIRFLDTGRFVWLDGSHWVYADWLRGEPNNTADKEDCLEVLPTGKFNDFTCWEPQAFICSYPYQ